MTIEILYKEILSPFPQDRFDYLPNHPRKQNHEKPRTFCNLRHATVSLLPLPLPLMFCVLPRAAGAALPILPLARFVAPTSIP